MNTRGQQQRTTTRRSGRLPNLGDYDRGLQSPMRGFDLWRPPVAPYPVRVIVYTGDGKVWAIFEGRSLQVKRMMQAEGFYDEAHNGIAKRGEEDE